MCSVRLCMILIHHYVHSTTLQCKLYDSMLACMYVCELVLQLSNEYAAGLINEVLDVMLTIGPSSSSNSDIPQDCCEGSSRSVCVHVQCTCASFYFRRFFYTLDPGHVNQRSSNSCTCDSIP